MSVRSGNSGRKKNCKDKSLQRSSGSIKTVFHIQNQEHKTIIRDESKIKANEVEKEKAENGSKQ